MDNRQEKKHNSHVPTDKQLAMLQILPNYAPNSTHFALVFPIFFQKNLNKATTTLIQ